MGQIGISLYPEQTTVAKATAYLEMAHQLGYRRGGLSPFAVCST